jgi:ABC-type sugar transport system ATPase subunit
VLEIRNLVKDFPGVRAVDDVSFDIKRNTIHCLVGENGAGKSTLIKILTGAYTRSSGNILLNGEEFIPRNTREAKQKGISTLFQSLMWSTNSPLRKSHVGNGGYDIWLFEKDRQDQQDDQSIE